MIEGVHLNAEQICQAIQVNWAVFFASFNPSNTSQHFGVHSHLEWVEVHSLKSVFVNNLKCGIRMRNRIEQSWAILRVNRFQTVFRSIDWPNNMVKWSKMDAQFLWHAMKSPWSKCNCVKYNQSLNEWSHLSTFSG